jgi:hypothetical protein
MNQSTYDEQDVVNMKSSNNQSGSLHTYLHGDPHRTGTGTGGHLCHWRQCVVTCDDIGTKMTVGCYAEN